MKSIKVSPVRTTPIVASPFSLDLVSDFARQQIAAFDDDIAKSKRVTLEAWTRRPLAEKLVEKFVRLLDTQL